MNTSNSILNNSDKKTSLLINRNFALLWGGQAISQIGDFVFGTTIMLWIATVLAKGQPWAPLAISGDLLALSIPMFTIGPFAGVFVDRWNKRQTMLWMDAIRAALILLLSLIAALTFFFPGVQLPVFWQLGIIYATIFLASTCSLFFNPARFTMLADIVSVHERPRATGLTQLSVNVAVIIGPLIATALFFSIGAQWALLLNALSFVVSFAGIMLIRTTGVSIGMMPGPQGSVLGEFARGIGFFMRNRLLRTLLITNVLFMIGGGALSALNIFFVTRNLHTATSFYGVLETVTGAGAIVGALIVAVFAQRIGVARMFWLSLLAIGLLTMIYARLNSLAPALVVTFLLGIPDAIFLAVNGPIMMHATPRQFMGRVMSIFMPITSLATVVSTAVVGFLISTVMSGFHATLFGAVFGPLDTIFTATGLIIVMGGVYALLRLRGVKVANSAMRPGLIIVERPRDHDGTPREGIPLGPGPVLVEMSGEGMPLGPGPVLVEMSGEGIPFGPGPVLIEVPGKARPSSSKSMFPIPGKEVKPDSRQSDLQTPTDL